MPYCLLLVLSRGESKRKRLSGYLFHTSPPTRRVRTAVSSKARAFITWHSFAHSKGFRDLFHLSDFTRLAFHW